MKILIEGERYPIEVLQDIFNDPKFYIQEGEVGTITSVGYYHNNKKNIVVHLLPKVFMRDSSSTVFGTSPSSLLNLELNESFKHKNEYQWVRRVSVYFYNSLLVYKSRRNDSSIFNNSLSYNLNSKLGNQEYSYLDLVLSFLNLYKKNKNFIAYRHNEVKTQDNSRVNWDKIFRKTADFFSGKGHPLYTEFKSKKKQVNREEELFIYFFSILNHFNIEHKLYISLGSSYNLITGSKFESLQKTGLSKLRKIKYRYFNDVFKKMYHLCELYFLTTDKSSLRNPQDEFISVTNYNLVFEDMVDKLFSDEITTFDEAISPSIKDLKFHSDGKILDHIFDYQSLIDTSNIFYIGDSKYYKPENLAGKSSQYKQFTYAKNVIQFNIDLLNSKSNTGYRPNIRYRDSDTEGYNITPNFFIYGFIDDFKNIDSPNLSERSDVVRSYHFEDRLFDRDSLFVHQYMINFLYVMKSYTQMSVGSISKFRKEARQIFRSNFLTFFNDANKSKFKIFEYVGDDSEVFLESNFRLLNGKCIRSVNGKLLIAIYESDKSLDDFYGNLIPHQLI